MSFKPHFSEIKQSNKDYIYLIHYAQHCTVQATLCYNSIGQSYSGVMLEAFVETFRGLLREFPNFLEEVDYEPRKELIKLGFVETEPSDLELSLYKK